MSKRETQMVQSYWKRVGGTAKVRSVALCSATDGVLEPLFEQYEDCEVVVIQPES